MTYAVGQVLKDKRGAPTGVLTIVRIYERKYPDGNVAQRIEGLQTSGPVCDTTDLDARSVAKMYPFTVYTPPVLQDDEENK